MSAGIKPTLLKPDWGGGGRCGRRRCWPAVCAMGRRGTHSAFFLLVRPPWYSVMV